MSLSTRKFLCALVLLVGLPIYIMLAAVLISQFDRPHPALEVAVYVVLGVLWALPLRRLFLGVARAEQPPEPTIKPDRRAE